jgi:hypothetical protein
VGVARGFRGVPVAVGVIRVGECRGRVVGTRLEVPVGVTRGNTTGVDVGALAVGDSTMVVRAVEVAAGVDSAG